MPGPSLENLYDFLVEMGCADSLAFDRDAAAISRCGLDGESETCAEALDPFAEIYGAAAGNIAQTVTARGGVYLAGGIAPEFVAKLMDGTFLRAFRSKRRAAPILNEVPVRVVHNDKAALIGAGLRAAKGNPT